MGLRRRLCYNSLTNAEKSEAREQLGDSKARLRSSTLYAKIGFTKKLTLKIDCAPNSFLEAEAAPAESDCVAREGISARRAKTNLPMCLRRCESSSLGRFTEQLSTCLHLSAAEVPCKTAPFASFSGRTEKEGPARPERVSTFSSLIMNCAAGIADATSFSLLDAKRTKQEKHAWGSVPHGPRARRFGSGQLSGTLKPVRRKGFKLTASRRFRQEAFSFPRCARKFPHEPRPQFGAMLPWPIVT